MNEDAIGEGKGMKWALRLVAPFCLVLVLVLGWQEHELVTNGKFMLDDVTKGEPLPCLTALLVIFSDYIILTATALMAISLWSFEVYGPRLIWGLSLGLATFLVAGLFPMTHFAFHHLPFHTFSMRSSSPEPPPPEHECPVCHGWKSWPESTQKK